MKKKIILGSFLIATILILTLFTPLFSAYNMNDDKRENSGNTTNDYYSNAASSTINEVLDSSHLEDTKITPNYPDYNHGARTSLNVDKEKYNVLMRWNLSDYLGEELINATLRLYNTDPRNIGETIILTLTPFLNDSWVEGTGYGNQDGPDGATWNEWNYSEGAALTNTWNGYPHGPGSDDLSIADSIDSKELKVLNEYIEFNVTELIQKYLDEVFDWRNGFFMTSGLYFVFPSSESISNSPELSLTIMDQNNPPFIPSNPYPPHGEGMVDINVDLSWTGGDPDGDPVTYDVYFGTTSTPPKVVDNQSDTIYDPGTLEFGRSYYWKIVSWDNHGASAEGLLWKFTTLKNNPPNNPTDPYPEDGAIDVVIDADLSWDGGDPDHGDLVFYDIYFGTNPDPPFVIQIGPYPWGQTRISWDPGVLEYATEYYWKIIPLDEHVCGMPGPIWTFITGEEPNNPPHMPSNPNPANGSVGIDINLNLSWDGGDPDSGDQVIYYIFFGTDPNPPYIENIGPYPAEQIEISWNPGTLEYNTMYYWKIIAYDGQYYVVPDFPWEFTTEEQPNNPPYPPSNPNPANGSTGIDINVDLSWTCVDPDGDPLTFDVYFGTSTPPPQVSWNQTATSYDPGTLDYETIYYWKIVSWDNHGASMEGPEWDFTTDEEPNDPPYVPSNPDPPDGAIDVVIDADLSWDGGDPDHGDLVFYGIYFGTNPDPPFVIQIGPYPWDQTRISWDPGTLEYNTMYYWKILAYDGQYYVIPDFPWEFTTEEQPNNPPYPPSNPNPANGSTGIDIEAELRWTGGDPDLGDTVTYDIYFGTVTPPPKIIANQSEDYYAPGVMNYNTTYYWQIVSWDNNGASAVGFIWSFTTNSSDFHNIPIIISAPSVGGPGIDLNFTAVCIDPNGYDILLMWDWGDGNFSDWLGPFSSSENVTVSYNWIKNEAFEIRVKAKNIHEVESGWSEPHIISISKQVELRNIRPGFVYFNLGIIDEFYAYIDILGKMGFSVGLVDEDVVVEVDANESVQLVKFEAYDLFLEDYLTKEDNDSSDGFSVDLISHSGIWQLTVYSYDSDGNMIDKDELEYFFCIHLEPSEGAMGSISKLGQRVRNRFR